MATNPLGTRFSHDVGTECDWLTQETTHAEGIVDNQGDTSFVRNIRNSLEIRNVKLRISNRLAVDSPRILVNSLFDVFGLVAFDKFANDVEFLHVNAELSHISTSHLLKITK